MPEYTLLTALSVVSVIGLELLWLRTGLFRQPEYWLSLGLIVGFQVLVDGWLTKLNAPIVLYNPPITSASAFPGTSRSRTSASALPW